MKKGVLIELTALLDVILILLFLVLVYSSQKVEEIRAAAAAPNISAEMARIQALQDENESLERRMETYRLFEQNCHIVTLSIAAMPDDTRVLYIETKDKPKEQIPLSWDNTQYARNALNAALGLTVQEAMAMKKQFVFIVFQYDRNTVYQSDYRLVSSAIQAQKALDNVYSAEYDMVEMGRK